MEKKLQGCGVELENCIEADFQTLSEENRQLKDQLRRNEWALFGALTRIEQMETRMDLLQAQVTGAVPTPVVDLMREELEVQWSWGLHSG